MCIILLTILFQFIWQFLQINPMRDNSIDSYLIVGIGAVTTALVFVFFLFKDQGREIKKLHEDHDKKIQEMHEKHDKELKDIHDEYLRDVKYIYDAIVKQSHEVMNGVTGSLNRLSGIIEDIRGGLKNKI